MRKSRSNCPICGKPMPYYCDVLDGHCLMEENEYCESGCYSYSYTMGVSEVKVGKRYLIWRYDTSHEDIERISRIIDRLVVRLKKKTDVKEEN